uniref:HTH_48 domain-containing protein n=1 Tax=Meloidogyne hapla TaxID=6305 RepID=A0A1I8B8F1_MELHA
MEVRVRFIHEFELGHSAKETWRNLCRSMGEDVVSYATTKRWFKKFREGQEDLNNKERLGRPPRVDMNAVLTLIETVPTMTTHMLAESTAHTCKLTEFYLKLESKFERVDGCLMN